MACLLCGIGLACPGCVMFCSASACSVCLHLVMQEGTGAERITSDHLVKHSQAAGARQRVILDTLDARLLNARK